MIEKIIKYFLFGILLFNNNIFCFAQDSETILISFSPNEVTLSKPAKNNIDVLLKKINNGKKIEKIEIYSHIGLNNEPIILFEKRNNETKKYLVSCGINEGFIKTKLGIGMKNHTPNNIKLQESNKNRIVEIIIYTDSIIEKEIKLDDAIHTAKVGSILTLRNINFYPGSADLLPESMSNVNELLKIMIKNPSLKIEIRGFICCAKTDFNNLSIKRAKTIYTYLLTNKIDADRVSYRGFGTLKPIYPYPEKDENERIANRRVEIKIVDI